MPLFGIRPNDDDFLVPHLGDKGAYSTHASRFGLPLPSTGSTGLFKDDAQALAFRLPSLDSRSGTAALFEDVILNNVVLKQKQEQQRAANVHERHALEVERTAVDNLLLEKEQSTPGPSTRRDIWGQAASNEVHKSAPQLSTWDNLDRSDKSYASPFFSEAPARVWEAELSLTSERTSRAPAYAHAVILDNLMTIVRGLDSVLFAWDTEKERYVWRADLKGKAKSGLENRGRFVGISLEASHSYIQRFFFLATSMSRLDEVARSLVEPSSNPSTIAHAVSSSLSAFIDWAREEVVRLCPTQLEDPSDPSSRDGLAVVWARLADLARVVESVSTIFQRQYRMVPPLAPMPRTTASLLSLLHDNLKHHLAYSLTPPLLEQTTSAWLLNHALSAWWTGWEAWVGIAESSHHESEHTWADLGIEVEITKRELSMLQVRNAGSGMEELSRTRYRLHLSRIPTFFPRNVAIELFEAGRALRLLRRAKPDHPLSRPQRIQNAGRGIRWDVGDDERYVSRFFQAVRTRVAQLRNDVRAWQVGKYAPVVLPDNTFLVKLDVHTSASSLKYPAELADLFGRFTALSVANALTAPHWSTDTGIGSFLADRIESPTFSILPPSRPNLDILLSTSLYRPLSIFGHLPSAALLTLFFTDLALTSHLDVLHSFLLFGDASFVQRFRDALFAPPEEREGSSIQRRRARDVNVWGTKDQGELGAERDGWGIGIGIRGMTDQTNWPPGGAELALALRAALAESIQERIESVDRKMEDPQMKHDKAQVNDAQVWRSVDSRLSFAYRHDEVEMDPNSLTAFNFLYLDYKAPSPLDLVIIPSVQGKYQQIFTHLLKMMRIEAVMRNLTLDITKPVVFGLSRNGRLDDKTKGEPVPSLLLDVKPFDFRARKALIALCFELRTLVNSITGHAYHSAIDANVSRFKTSLQGIERALHQQLHPGKMCPTDEEEDDDPDSAGVWNLETLELVHQQFLDRILLSLLLQKRQRPLMRVVTEGIFQVVLDLGRAVKKWKKFQASGTWPVRAEQTILEEILGMHRGLTSQASTLVKVLQALDDRGSSAKASSSSGSSSSFKDQRGKKLLEEMEAGFEAKSVGYLSEWVFALDANRFYAGLSIV
ncbi:BZ3500_MvSof-1268-A1-R1_Chr1-1g01112 [Microbotryum saponariae]|uniref:BZ3500_MvSof-1268-A1-R1_Chr1-1g01112 protein n=1 Tax=Microbotryum saponariae TaxID=289078 RepID=A0A2X0KKU0_9BASI|nr:BZ3500_MvSof-1268-A1-R1_Chr1-1g01112 [Microbotryum saponariae]SCZ93397.1 BZ3501_MvSof-1269-A2-R1_Chr1-1g00709 [Microbotryum saponariae]